MPVHCWHLRFSKGFYEDPGTSARYSIFTKRVEAVTPPMSCRPMAALRVTYAFGTRSTPWMKLKIRGRLSPSRYYSSDQAASSAPARCRARYTSSRISTSSSEVIWNNCVRSARPPGRPFVYHPRCFLKSINDLLGFSW